MDFKTARGTWRWMGAMNANDENSWSFFFGFYYVLLGDLSCFFYGNFATVCNITFKRLLVLLPNPWGDWGGVLPDPATVVLWGVWTLEGYFGLVWKSSSDCPVYFNFLYKQNVNFFLWFTTSRISQFIKEGKKYIVSAVCWHGKKIRVVEETFF